MSRIPKTTKSAASTDLNVKTVNSQENAPMNNTTGNVAQDIFNSRRQFQKGTGWSQSLNLSETTIAAMNPLNVLLRLLGEGRIRVTNVANATRKDGLAVLFPNGPQTDQHGRALALYENVNYLGQSISQEAGSKVTALLDKTSDHDLIVYETRNPATGWIEYRVFFANRVYNQHGEVVELRDGGEDLIQKWINDSVEGGYTGNDGIVRMSYNQYVSQWNEAVVACAGGNGTEAQLAMIQKSAKSLELLATEPNKFAQFNHRYTVDPASVVNKYALLSWLVLDTGRPAYEIYNRAKTVESNQAFIEGTARMMERGYRNQLRALSGLYASNDTATE